MTRCCADGTASSVPGEIIGSIGSPCPGVTVARVQRGDVSLFVDDAGLGPAVLLHTGGGGDGRMWTLAGYDAALQGYRRLALDHRGHGQSSKPEGRRAHLLSEYVSDAVAVLDAAGADRAALVGYSDGAQVAYAVAAGHPDRVSAVLGIGAVGAPDEDPAMRARTAAAVRARGMGEVMADVAAREPHPAPPWLIDNLASTPTEMFALELEGWSTAPGPSHYLPLLQAPTLIICGELEETDAAAHAHDAAQAMPRGRSVIIAGAGHLEAFWRTDQTAPLIRDFLHEVFPASNS